MTTDTYIIAVTSTIFILVGFLLPFVHTAFGEASGTDLDAEGLTFDLGQGNFFVDTISIIFSIFLMFFWTFGALPVWLDLIFVILRLMFLFSIVRTVRGV